jgi:hypothetical protein
MPLAGRGDNTHYNQRHIGAPTRLHAINRHFVPEDARTRAPSDPNRPNLGFVHIYYRTFLHARTFRPYKLVVGDGLRFRKDDRRATEVGIAVTMLNRMLAPGRSRYVRVS